MAMTLSAFSTTLNGEHKIYYGSGAPTDVTGLFIAGDKYYRTDATATGTPYEYIATAAGGTWIPVSTVGGITPKGGTASATSGAATLSQMCGVITSEALTTAAGAAYTLTLTNTKVAATSIVLFSVCSGTNTQGVLVPGQATPGSGSVVITVRNEHASQALNGTIKVSFLVINPV